MIQKCPKCGAWCITGKDGFCDKMARGGDDDVAIGYIGYKIEGFIGNTDKIIRKFLGVGTKINTGSAALNGLREGLAGVDYRFECPECGNNWGTDDEEDDQTAEYEHEQKIHELRDIFPSVSHSQCSEKQQYINDLRILLASPLNTDAASAVLYATLAAAYYSVDDRNSALQAVNSSLKLFEDDNTHILKGMIMGKGRNAQDTYSAMQEVIRYKSPKRPESPFFTTPQIEDEFAVLQSSFSKNFLSIPLQQRKYLVFCDNILYLPQNIRVLPISEIPTEIKFPEGHYPVSNTLYVCHPYRDDYYIPYEIYEVEILRDEISELKLIMEFLGAKHIDYSDLFENGEESAIHNKRDIHGGGDYAGEYSAHGDYEAEDRIDVTRKLRNFIKGEQDYLLKGMPALPQDLVWYSHRLEWQRKCESRLAGRLIHDDFTISTSTSEMITESERKRIEADLKVLLVSAEGGTDSSKSYMLKKERERTWKVNVEFYPLSDYEKKEPQVPLQLSSVPSNHSEKKQNRVVWIMGGIILALIITLLIVLF